MKIYTVTLLTPEQTDSLYLLCALEAKRVLENATFKPRKEGALDHVTNLLLRQCKAFIVGLVEYQDLYVDLPLHIRMPSNFIKETHISNQVVWRTGVGYKPYTVPAFTFEGTCKPADEWFSLLSYEAQGGKDAFSMYNDILSQPPKTKGQHHD